MLIKIKKKIYRWIPERYKPSLSKILDSNIGKRIFAGAFWAIVGAVMSNGMMIVSSMIIARFLGQEQYGELGIIRSTINTFAVFAGFGIGVTATKYISELRVIDKERTGKIIGLSTIFSIIIGLFISTIFFVLSDVIASSTLNAPALGDELKLGAIMLLFSAINGSQVGILTGFEAFKSMAKVNILTAFVTYPVQIYLAYVFGLIGAVVGFGFFFIFYWLLNYSAVRKETKRHNIEIQYFNILHEWPILYKFSLPALLSGIMVSPVIWWCNAILVNQPNGFKELAVFEVANQWRGIVLFIPAALGQIVLPILSNLLGGADHVKYSKVLKFNILLNIAVVSIFITPILIFPNFILGMYGSSFVGNEMVINVLVFTAIFSAVCNVVGQAIASSGKMWHGFFFNGIWAIILVLSTVILVNQNLGALALSYAFLISYVVHAIIQTIYVYKLNKRLILKNY